MCGLRVCDPSSSPLLRSRDAAWRGMDGPMHPDLHILTLAEGWVMLFGSPRFLPSQ